MSAKTKTNGKSHGDKLKKANQVEHKAKGVTSATDSDGFVRVDDNYEKVEFKKHGDSFIGYYTGKKLITPNEDSGVEPFNIRTFYTADGRRCSTPDNYQFKKLDEITEMTTTQVKIIYISDVKVEKGNMKQFDIRFKFGCEEIPSDLLVTF